MITRTLRSQETSQQGLPWFSGSVHYLFFTLGGILGFCRTEVRATTRGSPAWHRVVRQVVAKPFAATHEGMPAQEGRAEKNAIPRSVSQSGQDQHTPDRQNALPVRSACSACSLCDQRSLHLLFPVLTTYEHRARKFAVAFLCQPSCSNERTHP